MEQMQQVGFLQDAILAEIRQTTKDLLLKEFPYAQRGFISVKEASNYLNYSPDTVRQMIEDGTLKALKKGDTCEHHTIFFSSVLEYVESLKSPEFEYDKYFRNEQGARMRGKAGIVALCETLKIEPKYKKAK